MKVDFLEEWQTHPDGNLLDLKQAEWETLPSVSTYGLSFKERVWTVNHAPAILASPIQRDDKFIGCVAIDCPPGLLESVFEHSRARGEIFDAAQVIARLAL